MGDDNPTFNAVKERWGANKNSASDNKEKTDVVSKLIKTVPFSSARKWSAAEFKEGSLVFGAPEFVLKEEYEKVKEKCETAQNEGLRVLTLGESVCRGV